ncbi:hypothetical protein Tco_0971395 [Tanacetum coccineum]
MFGSSVETFVHDPLFYVLILGVPLSLLYARASQFFLNRGYLDSATGVGLTVKQCFLLISAGSLSHFFLDHLFEENGHSTMYTWILSTGWWEGRAPVNPDAVVVIGFLCTCLILGFIHINRVKPEKSIRKQSINSAKLLIAIASTYSLWCVSQIYLVNPRRPAVGEEADLGVIVFLAFQRRTVGDAFQKGTEQGPQIDSDQFQKILKYIKSGVESWATLECGGDRFGSKGYYIQPTVFSNVKDDTLIAQDEMFGPVQTILKFKEIDDVIKRANATRYGLAAGAFTKNIDTANKLTRALRLGQFG